MLPVNFRFGGYYLLESETGGLKTHKVGLLVHASSKSTAKNRRGRPEGAPSGAQEVIRATSAIHDAPLRRGIWRTRAEAGIAGSGRGDSLETAKPLSAASSYYAKSSTWG